MNDRRWQQFKTNAASRTSPSTASKAASSTPSRQRHGHTFPYGFNPRTGWYIVSMHRSDGADRIPAVGALERHPERGPSPLRLFAPSPLRPLRLFAPSPLRLFP
ncbi:MAG: hypothetical protein IPM83_16745 [Ignavibacteria bacterium]|nr:hypothetical protein [Ignavibacteria bacterium]